MEIKRDRYLNKLISFMWDGQVKVITAIRSCGKSYLLKNLFLDCLLSTGVAIMRHDIRKRWYDNNGILNIGIIDFLLDDSLL